ncbi:autophagy-related protein 11-domain-containing protein [Calycina marina]|uniref:Autophagy-related protein 11 n=1 Tax=Calycina marina TaxID=1763456 RepID=A0A9P7ZBG1_9HELO|nr:autophagy-related protein 11-domain-containing protein [Calycina marina]
MALQVLIAHSGQRLQIDPASFPTLDGFKSWVAQETTISVNDHIALTTSGRAARYPSLTTEKEIFIYDRRIIQPSSAKSARSIQSDIPTPAKYNLARPPDTIADQTDLQAWRDLFMARRTWALKVVEDSDAMSVECQNRYGEIEVIMRAVDAAIMNIEKHVKALDQKHANTQTWAQDTQKEQGHVGRIWEGCLNQLQSLPARSDMLKFITGRDGRRNLKASSLEELINVEEVKEAGKLLRKVSSELDKNGAELGNIVDTVHRRADVLWENVNKNHTRAARIRSTDPPKLMQDIEPLATKVSHDYENILDYADTQKNKSQASKAALLHTNNTLPTLSKRAMEMNAYLQTATEMRNKIASDCLNIMHEVSALTSMLSDANSRFASMEMDENAFDALNLLATLEMLPVTYASFVAEAIRRREWNEKVKADSSTLANDLAIFQDEELRRRRRWQKNVGMALWGDKAEGKVMGLEINLHEEDEEWPAATREDIEELVGILELQDAEGATLDEVRKVVSELDNPTKQQSKRAKAFKAGSIHESAIGRSGLLLRGDDDLMRVLQDDKAKMEVKLKTAESRVRRLEDLLHRQTHVSRNSNGNVFRLSGHPSQDMQNMPPNLVSPRFNEDMSRRSSLSSRRFSANQGPEEKAVAQKLLGLEAELIAERERTAGMEKEISAKTSSVANMKTLVDEANSLKKDLMGNFEAQQREFVEERKSLEVEIKRLKGRLEEQEDEMDRLLGSRENEKSEVDDRVRSLQDDLDRTCRDAASEVQKAQGQVDYLRNDAKLQRESNDTLEKQLQTAREENKLLLIRAEKAESTSNEQWNVLYNVHTQLVQNSAVPQDFASLRDVLISSSGDLVAKLESVKSAAVIARADRDSSQTTLTGVKSELATAKDQLSKEVAESTLLREQVNAQLAKFWALERELCDERAQLSSLRSKMSDGETGSETLRTRLEAEEKKVTTMSEDLAFSLSKIGSLEEEVRTLQNKYQSAQGKHEKLMGRFETRTERAKDLTLRVFAQNDRLCRLLERLSFSVTREGGNMTIQKMPKLDRSVANVSSDPDSATKRSMSGTAMRKAMVDNGVLDLLYWMHNDDPEIESDKYEAYTNAIGNFDVEAFCEVIAKRIKDIEYTAKKYSKDARAYREKSHMAQKEAHEKIAFKNFKEGDLALFLPTRNQATGAWAAFNVGAPHYFLREQDSHKLRSRDWLVARISKIEDRVVDLSKSMSANDGRSFGEASNGGDSFEDDNPFDLSDGLRWYLIDAAEEKPGAPSTPGLGKSTVASANIDATGSIRRSKKSSSSDMMEGINKTLSKSLDSRRSSTNSKKAITAASPLGGRTGSQTSLALNTSSTPVVQEEPPSTPTVSSGNQHNLPSSAERTLKPEVRVNEIDGLLGL